MPATDEEILAELREIKKLLTPATPPPPPPAPKGIGPEFKAFISEYKVLGLAVAFILGVYLGALVKALVGDLILPIIGLVYPGANLTGYSTIFRGQTFMLGDFLNAVITFLIVAFVIFLIVKLAKRYKVG
jgi:large conductance mechanosensitive channel